MTVGRIAAVTVVVGVLAMAGALVAGFAWVTQDVDPQIDCRTAQVDGAAFRSGTPGTRASIIGDISACRLLDGRSRAEVEAQLGPPDVTNPRGLPEYRALDRGSLLARLEVEYAGDRVRRASIPSGAERIDP